MDYKKKYENALPYIKDLIEHNVISIENAGKYFPELKESEGERIRKGIIKYLSWIKDKDGSYMPNNIPFDDMIAWLEKQGEQKELSQSQVTKTSDIDDDLDALEQAIFALEDLVDDSEPNTCYAGCHLPFKEAIKKLKSLKQRLNK